MIKIWKTIFQLKINNLCKKQAIAYNIINSTNVWCEILQLINVVYYCWNLFSVKNKSLILSLLYFTFVIFYEFMKWSSY